MMDLLQGRGGRLAVVDVETTGVYNSDRIVEVAVVTLSARGRVIDEWDTLVNPKRDVGATHIHNITPSMVSAAPTFAAVAAALAERLHGAVVVAHNLSFDSRMLLNEFARTGGELRLGTGICTLEMSHLKLADACRRWGIPLNNAHCALADARAAADLLKSMTVDRGVRHTSPASVDASDYRFRPRTLRRKVPKGSGPTMPEPARLAGRRHRRREYGGVLVYVDLLDSAISDLVITGAERVGLSELAAELGLSPKDVMDTHRRYLDELVTASLQDDVIDANELATLETVARELGVDFRSVTDRIDGRVAVQGSLLLEPGMRVCFTGSAMHPDGTQMRRSELESIAERLRLLTVKNVSKKGCDLLVAADPMSQSGKTRQARKLGIPVASVEDFVSVEAGRPIATS